MIQLYDHINHTIEAPFIDAYDMDGPHEVAGDKPDQWSGHSVNFPQGASLQVGSSLSIVPIAYVQGQALKQVSEGISLKKGESIIVPGHATTSSRERAIAVKVSESGGSIAITSVAYTNDGSVKIEYTADNDCTVYIVDCCNNVSVTKYVYSLLVPPAVIKYYAVLWDKLTGKKTIQVPSQIHVKDANDPIGNDNAVVYFHFNACKETAVITGDDGGSLDIFDDGAKLTLAIYNENHEEAWIAKNAYKFNKTKIHHNP